MTELVKLLLGEYQNQERPELHYSGKVRVANCPHTGQWKCSLKVTSASSMNVTFKQGESTYVVDIETRDLLMPESASIMWLYFLLKAALDGEVAAKASLLTFDELQIGSVYLRKRVYPPRSVKEEDAAAVHFDIEYLLDGEPFNLAFQIPKLLEMGWGDLYVPEPTTVWRQLPPPVRSSELHDLVEQLEREKQQMQAMIEEKQAEIMQLKNQLTNSDL